MLRWLARLLVMIAAGAVLAMAGYGMWVIAIEATASAANGNDISRLIPSGAEMAQAWLQYRPDLLGAVLWNTVRVTLLGLSIAIVLGLVLATLMDLIAPLRWVLYPLLVVSQTIPTFAIAVMLIVVFGFGDSPKIVVVVLFCFFAVATNTLAGFQSVDPAQVDLVRAMGASPLAIWWKVRLPSAMPAFFSGVRLAATYSVVGAVIGEYVGSGDGLGKFLQRSYRAFQTDQVFLTVAIIALVSVGLVLLVTLVERVALRWRYVGREAWWWRLIRLWVDT